MWLPRKRRESTKTTYNTLLHVSNNNSKTFSNAFCLLPFLEHTQREGLNSQIGRLKFQALLCLPTRWTRTLQKTLFTSSGFLNILFLILQRGFFLRKLARKCCLSLTCTMQHLSFTQIPGKEFTRTTHAQEITMVTKEENRYNSCFKKK